MFLPLQSPRSTAGHPNTSQDIPVAAITSRNLTLRLPTPPERTRCGRVHRHQKRERFVGTRPTNRGVGAFWGTSMCSSFSGGSAVFAARYPGGEGCGAVALQHAARKPCMLPGFCSGGKKRDIDEACLVEVCGVGGTVDVDWYSL